MTSRSISAGGVHQTAPRVNKKGLNIADHQRHEAPLTAKMKTNQQADERSKMNMIYMDSAAQHRHIESSSSIDSIGPAARNMSMKKAKRSNFTRPRQIYKPLAIIELSSK